MKVINKRDEYDYVYNLKDLIEFNGSKMHKQNLKKFLTTNNYSFQMITSKDKNNLKNIIEYYKKWVDNIKCSDNSLEEEKIAFFKMLNFIDELDIKIGILLIDNKLNGFCIATIFQNTIYIHIEKSNRKIRGSYQALIHLFSKKIMELGLGITKMNREEDLGHKGIRRNKMSYKPIEFIEKSLVLLSI